MSMIRKYHNHKPQTTPWHHEEDPLNHHETPGRQIKQSNQLSLLHIDKPVKKGNSSFGFLCRNLRINKEEVKGVVNISLVRPNLKYCSTFWNPYQMLHLRAARYITNGYYNTSSVTDMMDHLEMESLESRRTRSP